MNGQPAPFGAINWAALAAQAAQAAGQNRDKQGGGKKGGGKKKSGGGLGGVMSLLGGIMSDIGGIGEPAIGDMAPNINGMEGMGIQPGAVGSASPINVPAPIAATPPISAPTQMPAGSGMEGMTLNTPAPMPTPEPTGHPYTGSSAQPATYQPGVGQMVPVPRNAVAYGPPAPGSPFAGIQNDPAYVNRIQSGPSALDMNNVREVHLHDRGGSTPRSGNFSKFPYHVEVQPSGAIHQTRAANQMGAGSYKSNPHSLHVAYGDKVGAMPTREAMGSLQKLYEQMKMHNPSWTFPSHGEAFNATRNSPFRASVSGRGLSEARWRGFLK